MYRQFIEKLTEWENKNYKEPLLVTGARQVGKTYIIKEFCEKTYDSYLYINLEKQPEFRSVFDDSLEPAAVIKNIEQLTGKRFDISMAVFIDEIQYSERAITALKYFCESDTNYRIIGAGSLLGVKLNRFDGSFPVGKVRTLRMCPMNFREFLLACGEDILVEGIEDAYKHMRGLVDGVHRKALSLYHDYLYVGGMPRSVLDYLDAERDVMRTDRTILENIRTAYLADMTKYTVSAAEGVKITETYDSVPRQLARENPKFKYNDIRRGGNKRDFASSVDWLKAAGLTINVKKLDAVRSPLKVYVSDGSQKLYMSDVGLLNSAAGTSFRDILPDSDNIFKGAVVENYVFQEFAGKGIETYYFKPSESMEIDMIYDNGDAIIPVEIKSGRHKRSKSLNNYIEKFAPSAAIRLSENNFGSAGDIRSIPLYAVFCI